MHSTRVVYHISGGPPRRRLLAVSDPSAVTVALPRSASLISHPHPLPAQRQLSSNIFEAQTPRTYPLDGWYMHYPCPYFGKADSVAWSLCGDYHRTIHTRSTRYNTYSLPYFWGPPPTLLIGCKLAECSKRGCADSYSQPNPSIPEIH
jgi:hypothetical protein